MGAMQFSLRAAQARGKQVWFIWSDGFEARFASAWLVDNARSSRDAVSGQRVRTAQSLALAGPILSASLSEDTVRLACADEIVEWSGAELRASAKHAAGSAIPDERTLWADGADVAARPPIAYSRYLTDDEALGLALSEVATFGLVRLTGAGAALDELERAVRRFGFIRETNYGRLFDVRIVANPSNLADTAQALEPHTDNPYRDPVPALQLLHCIKGTSQGGETFFLDGFALAAWFRSAHRKDFARLAGHAVPFVFIGPDSERFEARSSVLRLTVDGHLSSIRFNHRAFGAVAFAADQTERWYESYLKFSNAANGRSRRFAYGMTPGDIVMFDNERILHGRNAFSGKADRLLRGCYSDRDGLLATLARLSHRPPH